MDHFDEELRQFYALALESFRNNFLYTPISEEDFLKQYQGIRPYIRPELVLIAEQRDRPIGFMLAVPDLLQAKRGQAIDTSIHKTFAVHPQFAGMGLGTLLGLRSQEAAYRLGYRRAIHALMHENNRSRRMSDHYARPIRRYTLFAKKLT
jgi:GNAT superfamily N-acetyltransferase